MIRSLSIGLLGLVTLGCGTPTTKAPIAPRSRAVDTFVAAWKAEMTDGSAFEGYLDAADQAVQSPEATGSLEATLAIVDALLLRADGEPERLNPPIAFRSRQTYQQVVLRLRQAWDALDEKEGADVPFMRMFIARGLHELALFAGEDGGAHAWAERRGCARQVTVVGPVDWAPLSSLGQPSPIASKGALAAGYPGFSPFDPSIEPEKVFADACEINPRVGRATAGTYDIVVDIENPTTQTLSFAVRSSSGASLRVGGAPVIERSYALGGGSVTRLGQARVSEGRVRVVLRLADRGDGGAVELDVVDERGYPVTLVAPAPGDKATVAVNARSVRSRPIVGSGREGSDLVVASLGMLALGEARAAERALEPLGTSAPPEALLARARAVEMAGDLPDFKRLELTSAIADAVLKVVPESWEAKLSKSEIAERRKGYGDGTFAALEVLGAKGPNPDFASLGVMELSRVISLSSRADMRDVAEAALVELAKRAPDSPLYASIEAQVRVRSGVEAVQLYCDGGLAKDSTSCLNAKLIIGDEKGALVELERIRRLRQAPTALREREINIAVRMGDRNRALSIYDSMPPGERSLMTILPLFDGPSDKQAAKTIFDRDRLLARDGLTALGRVAQLFGVPNEDAAKYEREGAALVATDRQKPALPGAATAVLRHVEHYGLDESGLFSVFFYDLRRVSGTTDVDQGVFVSSPYVEGRGNEWLVRRRIHKKDGRILEPEAADRAQQGASDLSQLEQGDYVEIIRVGYYMPGDSGQLTVDTPDLLPERTSIREAEVVVRLPEKMPISYWSHPLLGKAKEETRQGYKFMTYRLENKPPRRLEDGVAYLEQGVRLSFGTQSWPNLARSLRETVLSLDDAKDPFVAKFAKEAIASPTGEKDAANDRAVLGRVVDHVGRTIKVANGNSLTDIASMSGGGAQWQTARTMIEERTGARTWVLYRTLEELGFKVDLAVSETQPFASSATFPPHAGRFQHPLLIVHLDGEDVWVDADVEGPPLPPGRVSPELRGRSALLETGEMKLVSGASDDGGDDVSIALKVDDKGDARGAVSITLRGRQAQAINEAFVTTVGSERKELLRRAVNGYFPWADVDDVKLGSGESSWEVKIDATVTIAGFASPNGKEKNTYRLPGVEAVHYAFPRAYAGLLAQTYATRGARQAALSIDSPLQYSMKRRIELPPNMKVTKAPNPIEVKSAFLTAKRTTEQKGNVIEEVFSLSLPTGTIAPDAYRAFVDDVQAIDSGFLSTIRVESGQ